MIIFDKRLRAKIREYKKALAYEAKQMKRLIQGELDYAYLRELIKRCEDNRDLIVHIRTSDGAEIEIRTDRKPTPLRSEALFEQIESEALI